MASHGAALAVVFGTPLDWYWRAGLAALVLASLAYALGTQILLVIPWAVREAIWRSDGTWTLTLVSGEQVEARLLPSTFVMPRLLVLNFRHGRWRSQAMVLPSDALDSDLLRRLRVRLRLRGMADTSDTDPLA